MKILSYRINRFLALALGRHWATPIERKGATSQPNGQAPRRLLFSHEGQSLVEFGLMAPVMVGLLTALLSLGLCMGNYIALNNAEAEALKIISASSTNSNVTADPCKAVSDAVLGDTGSLISSDIQLTLAFNSSNVLNPAAPGPLFTCAKYPVPASTNPPTLATITLAYPCNIAVYGFNFARSCLLKTSNSVTIN